MEVVIILIEIEIYKDIINLFFRWYIYCIKIVYKFYNFLVKYLFFYVYIKMLVFFCYCISISLVLYIVNNIVFYLYIGK